MKQAAITIEQWHELAQNGAEVTARVIPRGSSMRPLIRGGRDEVEVRPFVYHAARDTGTENRHADAETGHAARHADAETRHAARLRVGDIAVFRRADGAYIIHRIRKVYYVQPAQSGYSHGDLAQPGQLRDTSVQPVHPQDTPAGPDHPQGSLHQPADTPASRSGAGCAAACPYSTRTCGTDCSAPCACYTRTCGTGRSTPCACYTRTCGTDCSAPCACYIQTQGDNCPGPDAPVPAEAVIGIVTAIYRDGRTIAPSGPAAMAAAAFARSLASLRRKAANKLHRIAKPDTPAKP